MSQTFFYLLVMVVGFWSRDQAACWCVSEQWCRWSGWLQVTLILQYPHFTQYTSSTNEGTYCMPPSQREEQSIKIILIIPIRLWFASHYV